MKSCTVCKKPVDARTLAAGGEVCYDCATVDLDFDKIAEQQGWNDQTCLFVLREFVSRAGLQDALNTFASEKAAEEEHVERSLWRCERCGWQGVAPDSEKCPLCDGGIWLDA